ncbi:alpha/beta hydrolase [Tsukamurella sp. 8F]|uniref:alpha/beta fold hydrolase n=1 Tax=unclassified Tsukamurella TaxID=2633480 RepID=UPI0023B8B2D9|nr:MULTISPECIES: alpha/beta hydrolase [unclassified Tsukamurella]MDF0531767.1 alpha/beta hydrolase [Tsukamurella sp. 8J]MDF0588031.1 alpha/beta hydrolase [Tsukamurella sp. 8F]
MSRRIAQPSVLAGIGAGAAVAAAAGITYATRAFGLRADVPDAYAGEDFACPVDRQTVLLSRDGIPLTVREVGPVDAPVTVIFVHGFTLRSASWHFVRRELERRWGPSVRMIFPDCRGHGDSGAATVEQSTVELLGDDIATVIDDLIPVGPIVLAGHSMGGMAIFGCASGHPELFGPQARVRGVALLGTAAHGLTDAGLATALRNPMLDLFRVAVRYLPSVVGHGRDAIKPIAAPLVTAGAYGTGRRSATMTGFSTSMSLTAPIATMAGFFTALERYDERAALPVLRRADAVVVCGDHDWLTPLRNSKNMAVELDCRFLVVEGAGHMLIMEAASTIAQALVELVARVRVEV